MPYKIYFSPSDQTRNTYAVGNTTEAIQCRKIALECVKIAERCGFLAKTNTTDDSEHSMENRVAESNVWGANLHIPIHTNAYNGNVQGTRIFVHKQNEAANKAAKCIMDTLSPITPGNSDSIAPAGFYEIMYSNSACVYVEVAFHDNAEEAQWIIDNTEEIAEAIVKGICNYYGVQFVEKESPEVRYNTINDVPEYAKPTIQKLMDCGALKGHTNGELDLSEDMVRMFVILDRMGKL